MNRVPSAQLVLAIDLDGTYWTLSTPCRPERAARPLGQLQIVLCTGRSFTETRPVLARSGKSRATVTVFGALVADVASGRTLKRTAIPLLLPGVTGWFSAEGFPVLWLTDPTGARTDGYVIAGPRRRRRGHWISSRRAWWRT
jgi:hypothetical protein